jgi:PAS domain S-box-containing protein
MGLGFSLLTLTPLLALLSYTVLLAVVLRRGHRSHLARLLGLYLWVMAVWSLGSAMMRLGPAQIVFWNKVTTGTAMIMPLAFFGFVQAFLDAKPGRWLWGVVAILLGLEVANALGLMTTNIRLLEGGLISFDVGPLTYAMAVINTTLMVYSLWCLARAHRQATDPVQRNRIRYPLIGTAAVLFGGLSNLVGGLAGYPVDHAANLLNAFLLAYAVLRYQLADITLVVRRGLFYSIPTAIIGAVYFLTISVAVSLFNVVAGPQLLLLSLLVAAVVAVLTQPLRDRAQLWIDRVFFREKYDATLMLQRLSRTAASVLDLEGLTSMILDEIMATMHIERAAFFLVQEEGGEFRLIAQKGLGPDADLRLRSDHPIVAWLSSRDEALTRWDMGLIPQFKALWGHETEDLQRLGAELYIPLKAKGDLVGILVIGPKLSEEAYSQDDQRMLTTLANQMATALENARLHEETRRRYRELALLNRVIAASATNQEVESLLAIICKEMASAFGDLQACALLLHEEGTSVTLLCHDGSVRESPSKDGAELASLLAEAEAGPADPASPGESHRVLQCLLGHTVPLIMDDAWTDPRLAPILDIVRQRGISSLLNLPLMLDGQVTGTICLAAIKPHPFTIEEINLAQRIAEQVSSALARARLVETQQRLTTAVEQAAEAVMITDTEGNILYINPAFEQMSGYVRADILGRNPRIFADDGQDDALFQHLAKATGSGNMWQGRFVSRRKGGQLYTGDATITPVRNRAGEIVNYVGTMRDVTREVQLEEQFRQSQKMEALGRLAGGVAHDFNNLLTVLNLSLVLMKRQVDTEDPLWAHLQRIDETAQRATKFTKQLLSFSRREIVEPRILDLNQVVEDLSGMLRRIIGEHIEFSTDLAQDPGRVRLDPSQLEQVLLNLVVNARDAMPEGGSLQIKTENVLLDEAYAETHPDVEPGPYLMLTIRDTGAGMDEVVKSHLFEPFFTTKKRGQGTGLGLSTVFGIVKQNQGHIRVESEVGQGTTFRIALPQVEDADVNYLRAAGSPESVRMPIGSETVLVVEDAADVRSLTVQTLRAFGYQVLEATDGVEALEVSEQYKGPIHLLLTDLVMPLMGGRELAETLGPQRPDMQIMYMSAYADRPLVKQAMSDPLTAFLPKPFTVETLTRKVRDVLERKT